MWEGLQSPIAPHRSDVFSSSLQQGFSLFPLLSWWFVIISLCLFLLISKVQTFISFLFRENNIKLFKWLPLSLNERGGRKRAMFLIIYLTSEQQSELNGPACCLFLLGSLRLHCFSCDIIFCPGLFVHGMRLLATVHANQKLWFMHLSCSGLNIKFNFAAVELCLPPAQAWHGEPGLPAAAQEFITSSTICESNIWMKHLSHVRTE